MGDVMKSIHAFSALLPGHGTSNSTPPNTNHSRPHSVSASIGSGNKITAIASLLAVALFQPRAIPRRLRD
jgi:hypothetical protein